MNWTQSLLIACLMLSLHAKGQGCLLFRLFAEWGGVVGGGGGGGGSGGLVVPTVRPEPTPSPSTPKPGVDPNRVQSLCVTYCGQEPTATKVYCTQCECHPKSCMVRCMSSPGNNYGTCTYECGHDILPRPRDCNSRPLSLWPIQGHRPL